MPSRNILNLLGGSPGVSSGGDATGINASQLSFNGSRTVNSEFMVDGVSVVSGSTGGVQSLPPTDAIREFKVLTSAYSAELLLPRAAGHGAEAVRQQPDVHCQLHALEVD